MDELKRDIEARYCGASVGPQAICAPGATGWYALRVQPQREDQAEAWLARRGVYAFHPVLTRKVNKRGVVRAYHRRYIPGLVFARFRGAPVVHAVTACQFITGGLCLSNGMWGELDGADLRSLHAMRKIDDAARSRAKARRSMAATVQVGDRALFRSGPFSGFTCEVLELRADGGAMVRLNLFGRECPAEAGIGDLVPLDKAG